MRRVSRQKKGGGERRDDEGPHRTHARTLVRDSNMATRDLTKGVLEAALLWTRVCMNACVCV